MDSTEPSSIGTGQAYQVYDQPNGIVNGRPLKSSLRRLVVAIFSHQRKLTPFFFSFFFFGLCLSFGCFVAVCGVPAFWPIACLVCLLGCFVVICLVSSFCLCNYCFLACARENGFYFSPGLIVWKSCLNDHAFYCCSEIIEGGISKRNKWK